MRFLLHRSVPTGLSKTKTGRTLDGAGKAATAVNGALDTSDVTSTSRGDRQVQWGQQCSPSCGCVVRFQGVVNPETKKYEAIDYVARQVVTHSPSGQGASLLTAKGRPMLKECTCGSLHHLASQATSHIHGKTTSQVKNMLEFHSTRSSAAFRKTALATQGLPPSDTRCFDVMEEALTAMVKGYMPPSRRQEISAVSTTTEQPRVTHLKGVGYHYWKREQDDSGLDFTKFWKYDTPNVSGPMSTLAMLDLSMSLMTGKEERSETEADAALPHDWQSYVDQLYEGDEQESA
eukprot:scaffold2335_cov175-Amphora_coffeaeformis.AAC.20